MPDSKTLKPRGQFRVKTSSSEESGHRKGPMTDWRATGGSHLLSGHARLKPVDEASDWNLGSRSLRDI